MREAVLEMVMEFFEVDDRVVIMENEGDVGGWLKERIGLLADRWVQVEVGQMLVLTVYHFACHIYYRILIVTHNIQIIPSLSQDAWLHSTG